MKRTSTLRPSLPPTAIPADTDHRARILDEVDASTLAVSCKATDYAPRTVISAHAHNKHQLIHAVQGIMVVQSEAGRWIVPPTRAIWMPAGQVHMIRCIDALHMRSLFVRPDAMPGLPDTPQTVAISPLLREMINAAVDIPHPYAADSADARLMRCMLDQLHTLPVLPLHLPQPTDKRLQRICRTLQQAPDDTSTLGDWAGRLGIDVKTIQRLFARDTGMTFGQWRQQARLLDGLERLARGDKVVDIALALGYDTPSAFTAMFKRQFGLTPSRFYR